MQQALSLFEKGPLALVAGEGFEPSTSGLWATRRVSLPLWTVSGHRVDLGRPAAQSSPEPSPSRWIPCINSCTSLVP